MEANSKHKKGDVLLISCGEAEIILIYQLDDTEIMDNDELIVQKGNECWCCVIREIGGTPRQQWVTPPKIGFASIKPDAPVGGIQE